MAADCVFDVDGQGEPIVLIHGIGARASLWADFVTSLNQDFTCVTYDLRGHGRSPRTKGTFGLDDLVDDLAHVMDKASIERAHLVGHSLGGMIGPGFARRYPDRVMSLGLLSTAAFRSDEDRRKLRAVVQKMRDDGVANSLDTLAARWFTDGFTAAHPERIEARKTQVIDTPEDVFLNVFDIYAETEMAPWLHEVTAPALIVTGELDAGCSPEHNRRIHAALPNAELSILDGLKHAILIEASDVVAAEVSGFLRRLPNSASVDPEQILEA